MRVVFRRVHVIDGKKYLIGEPGVFKKTVAENLEIHNVVYIGGGTCARCQEIKKLVEGKKYCQECKQGMTRIKKAAKKKRAVQDRIVIRPTEITEATLHMPVRLLPFERFHEMEGIL